MIFHHNFDFGDFIFLRNNGDGTAYFYRERDVHFLMPDARKYLWVEMRTDGYWILSDGTMIPKNFQRKNEKIHY